MAVTFSNMLFNGSDKSQFVIEESDLSQVTTIVDGCFLNCIGVNSIHIPGNVRTIGKNAFYGVMPVEHPRNVATSISIAEGVLWIRAGAFANMDGVNYYGGRAISFPSTLQTIERGAFQETKFSTLTFNKNSRVRISDYAFQYSLTDNLKTLDLTGVESIGNWALSPGSYYDSNVKKHQYTCKNTKLIIGSTLQKLGGYAFGGGVRENDDDDYDTYPFSYVDSSTMNPMLDGDMNALQNTAWFKNIATPTTGTTYVTGANGKILIGAKCGGEETLYYPSGLVNLGNYSMRNIGEQNVINAVKKVVIPDTVIWMQADSVPNFSLSLMATDIGESVSRIDGVVIGNPISSLVAGSYVVFRQPKYMNITINTEHLASTKDSSTLDIYTDNLVIRNYDWAGDNIIPIFHPLSEAPTR